MSLTIRPRSAWTDTPFAWPNFPSRLFTKAEVTYLAPHYPAVPSPVGVITETAEQSWMRVLRNWHVDGNGWADIGYALVIFQSGRVYMAGGITHSTAHAASMNRYAIGVLFMVGNDEQLTPAAIDTFNQLGPWLRDEQGFHALATVRDHGRLPDQATACAGYHIRAVVDSGALNLESKMARRAPTRADVRALETELRARGFEIYCGPSYVDRGWCAPGKHPHGATSAHFDPGGMAVDFGWPGPPIHDHEALHVELMMDELARHPDIAWRRVWNVGPGDHDDHGHVDNRLGVRGWHDIVRPKPGIRARDGVDLFVSPQAFPRHVPPSNHGYTLAHMVTAQTLLGRATDPDTGLPLLRGRVDGYWGPQTEGATRRAQRIVGVKVDGIPGPVTVGALRDYLANPPAPEPEPEPVPDDPPEPDPVDPPGRLAGPDRYATAAQVAIDSGATKVYLAAGNAPTLVDATAASFRGDGALLLVRAGQDNLPGATDTALRELRPSEVVPVGSDSLVTIPAVHAARTAAGIPPQEEA